MLTFLEINGYCTFDRIKKIIVLKYTQMCFTFTYYNISDIASCDFSFGSCDYIEASKDSQVVWKKGQHENAPDNRSWTLYNLDCAMLNLHKDILCKIHYIAIPAAPWKYFFPLQPM
jgi:hypothetical protein